MSRKWVRGFEVLRRNWWICGWCAIAILFVTHLVRLDPLTWSQSSGHEYEWIAQSIAAGEGFSFPRYRRWMFQAEREDESMPEFAPTAWKEPVYPYVLGYAMKAFGVEAGKFLVVLLQIACVAIAIALTYRLGMRLAGPAAGLLAAGILAASPGTAAQAAAGLRTSGIGAMIVVSALLLLLGLLQRPSMRKAIGLGVVVGAGALTLAPTLMMGPVTAVALLAAAVSRRSMQPIVHIVVVAIVSAIVISPWTVRNAFTFGEFIPVQTGIGNFANYTNGYLAETFSPGLSLDPAGSPPPWTSDGPLHAVWLLQTERGLSTQLIERSLQTTAANPPPGWDTMNEHQRDHVHLNEFKTFARDHFNTFLLLTASKALLLLFGYKLALMPLGVLAVLGVAVAWRQKAALILPLSVAMLAVPLLITAPMFYRYRMPMEPAIVVLAALTIVGLCRVAMRWRTHAPKSVADTIVASP